MKNHSLSLPIEYNAAYLIQFIYLCTMVSSKYKNVYTPNPREYKRKKQWLAKIQRNGISLRKYFKTEREAGEAIELFLKECHL